MLECDGRQQVAVPLARALAGEPHADRVEAGVAICGRETRAHTATRETAGAHERVQRQRAARGLGNGLIGAGAVREAEGPRPAHVVVSVHVQQRGRHLGAAFHGRARARAALPRAGRVSLSLRSAPPRLPPSPSPHAAKLFPCTRSTHARAPAPTSTPRATASVLTFALDAYFSGAPDVIVACNKESDKWVSLGA